MHFFRLSACWARSGNRGSYLIFASELGAGKLQPNADAILKRVEELESILLDDWNSRLEWLENDMGKTFSIARVQQCRNAALLGSQSPAQLTSMLAIMPPQAGSEEIVAFLQNANAWQRTWLQTASEATAESSADP